MQKKYLSITILLVMLIISSVPIAAQNKLIIDADQEKGTISRHIYGHFSEHLGRCIYGGYWVGEDSSIPNTRGIRNDVTEALKDIRIPNLRWPGGCFADEYHWMDGIGPRDQRPKMINTHWGGVVEDNSFGTHEFLDLCEQIDAEPYISGNVGSGTVEEMSKWIEYITFDGESPMANLRRQNGREEPWKVKFWGVGNESWGCGGNMTPDFYSDLYRQYATFCRNYGDNHLYKIACGANVDDYNWTETLMRKAGGHMNGLSLHYYTVPRNWGDKGSAIDFDEAEYFTTIRKTLFMNELITRHTTLMDRHDPHKRIGLIIDEWGTWYNVEPGTNPGFLHQQNTLRDAIVAGINLNIFNNHSDRVKMANLAQTVNVLQSVILTDNEKMVLTPTYWVFYLYKVHQDATLLPLSFTGNKYRHGNEEIDAVSVSASKDATGKIHITLVNADLSNEQHIGTQLRGISARKVTGKVLTSDKINDYNSFEQPSNIIVKDFKGATLSGGNALSVVLPAKAVVMIEIE
ncbi:alpha-N-arabinofuranosidase [uncultured Proteiniphilum sp.]|uniref:alpha-N-arabinofuranosidase n=1 Tax=uncultured Proteiniphilum sp. TaxID=497637 RepID=UPI002630123B|nr:alpha-N-arabinofuranosidase [uncultured Proteiniphilum sp.]